VSTFEILVETECGQVSGHYLFSSVPSSGDIVFISDDKHAEIKLRVRLVEHYPVSRGDVGSDIYITLQCEVVD
jgi:hypothetical protein